MPDKVQPGPVSPDCAVREAVCIHTKKVYDSCRDKDCVEDLRVYPTRSSQAILERATSVKCRSIELLWIQLDVEAVPFNRGFYTVDAKYYYRVTADAFCGLGRPQEVYGLASYDKRVLLFGSEGNAKVFSSQTVLGSMDPQSLMNGNMPNAVCEIVEPLCLGLKLKECCCDGEVLAMTEVPDVIQRCFDDELVLCGDTKRMYVTLGQFSIIRLERDTQLLMPAYDFCVPEKECCPGGCEEDPCELFSRINFPVDEFFPPAEKELGCDMSWRNVPQAQ